MLSLRLGKENRMELQQKTPLIDPAGRFDWFLNPEAGYVIFVRGAQNLSYETLERHGGSQG